MIRLASLRPSSGSRPCQMRSMKEHKGTGNACLYAAIAYWYQQPGQQDPYCRCAYDQNALATGLS